MRKTCITVSVEVAGGLEEALEALELEVDGLADRFPEPDFERLKEEPVAGCVMIGRLLVVVTTQRAKVRAGEVATASSLVRTRASEAERAAAVARTVDPARGGDR